MLSMLRLDYIIFGGLGVFLLLSILTSDFQDPTFFNQLYPSLGVKNWTGLIGALIGGSLIEIFGTSTLLIPWLIVRIALHHPRKYSVFTCYYYAFVIVFFLSIFHEISIHSGFFERNDSENFWQSGYAGKLGITWIDETIDLKLGFLALGSMLILSIVRMYHVLSPIPLFIGLYVGSKKLVKMIFLRDISNQTSENKNKKNLPIFKGHSHVFGNDSK